MNRNPEFGGEGQFNNPEIPEINEHNEHIEVPSEEVGIINVLKEKEIISEKRKNPLREITVRIMQQLPKIPDIVLDGLSPHFRLMIKKAANRLKGSGKE